MVSLETLGFCTDSATCHTCLAFFSQFVKTYKVFSSFSNFVNHSSLINHVVVYEMPRANIFIVSWHCYECHIIINKNWATFVKIAEFTHIWCFLTKSHMNRAKGRCGAFGFPVS